MLVMFLSASTGLARQPVAQVLDLYAHRIGPDCWTAWMTEKGLETVRMSLMVSATRGTSVLCRKVSGFSRKHTPVQWIVGSRHRFALEDGRFSVHLRAALEPSPSPLENDSAIRTLKRWATIAGACHDLGKNNLAFQEKLRKNLKEKDPVRHEILSTFLMTASAGEGMREADRWCREHSNLPMDMGSALDIIRWAVASHHALPGKEFSLTEYHVEPSKNKAGADTAVDNCPFPSCPITPESPENARVTGSPLAAAFYVRWGLMLADHFVSALDPSSSNGSHSYFTRRVLEHLNHPGYAEYRAMANGRQKLRGHLDATGFAAGWVTRYLLKNHLQKLLPEIESGLAVDQAGREGRYAWQGRAVDTISSVEDPVPSLCLVVASTGSGKTQACIAMADALCQRRGRGLRATVALGLRTLTLQTGDAYREALGMGPDQLSVLIGSQSVMDLHSAARDEEGPSTTYHETDASDFWKQTGFRLPPFIANEFVSHRHNDIGYLLTPVLVSTMDQVIQAADLRRSDWMKPMLRLASGPLILDEIDNYDLADMVPILRLIYFAGLLGQDVLCSTATLYPAVADAIIEAHRKGSAERLALFGRSGPPHRVGFFSDGQAGSVWADPSVDASSAYRDFCDRVCHIPSDRRRIMAFLPDYAGESEAWQDLGAQVEKLHEAHAWVAPDGGRLSIGMLRFARVRDVAKAAQVLAEYRSGAVEIALVPYHSRNFMLSRAFIEYRLDGMLRRGQDPAAPTKDVDVRKRLRQASSQGKSLCVVVVCSPVEEVGRDHDFDWGIIEPSSTRSIVQAAGRVLRHRSAMLPASSNVLVFRKPVRFFRDRGSRGLVYTNPGFECGEPLSNQHHFSKCGYDMAELLEMSHADATAVIDASWCLQTKRHLARIENRSIGERFEMAFTDTWLNRQKASLCTEHYEKHVFRKTESRIKESEVYLDVRNDRYRLALVEDLGTWDKASIGSMLPPDALLFSQGWSDILDFWADRLGGEDAGAMCHRYMRIDLREDDRNVDLVYGVFR
jgi:CRISPR-associated endonuclease/helicase Cas3